MYNLYRHSFIEATHSIELVSGEEIGKLIPRFIWVGGIFDLTNSECEHNGALELAKQMQFSTCPYDLFTLVPEWPIDVEDFYRDIVLSEECNPEIIDELMDSFFSDDLLKNASYDELLLNFRKNIFVTYSIGSRVVERLKDKIVSKLENLGFSEEQIQTLCACNKVICIFPTHLINKNQKYSFTSVNFLTPTDILSALLSDEHQLQPIKSYGALCSKADMMASYPNPNLSDEDHKKAYVAKSTGNRIIVSSSLVSEHLKKRRRPIKWVDKFSYEPNDESLTTPKVLDGHDLRAALNLSNSIILPPQNDSTPTQQPQPQRMILTIQQYLAAHKIREVANLMLQHTSSERDIDITSELELRLCTKAARSEALKLFKYAITLQRSSQAFLR